MIVSLESLGQAIAAWLVPALPTATLLLLAALGIDLLVARHVRAALRVGLYAPVALRVLVPVGWAVDAPQVARVATVLTPLPGGSPRAGADAVHMVAWWAVAVAVGYLIVAAALATRVILARVRLARLTRTARPAPAAPGTEAPIAVHDVVGPLVEGLLWARIVLPARLLEEAHAEALACVLRHEDAHVRRRDPWLLALLQLVTIVAWPVVPVWIAAWRVRQLIEVACDEAAVAGAGGEARRSYGHTLLDLAEHDDHMTAALGLGSLHFGSTLRARIAALASPRRWPGVAQGALVLGAVSAMVACGAARPVGISPDAIARGGKRGDAAPAVSLRELYECAGPGIASFDGDSARWRLVDPPPAAAPAQLVARCHSPTYVDAMQKNNWAAEARYALAQMGRDLSGAYAESVKRGTPRLCPSTALTPPTVPMADASVLAVEQFRSDPGWNCMMFSMDQPLMFQYRIQSAARGFAATALGQRRQADGRVIELSIVLRGRIDDGGELWLASALEETWRTL